MGRIFTFFVLLILNISFSYSQQSQIDSLQNVLKETINPENKAKLLGDIGLEYLKRQTYFDSAYFYMERAYDVAKEAKLQNLQARSLFTLASIDNSLGKYTASVALFKQTIPLLEKINAPVKLASAYNNIGANYFELKNYEQAIVYYHKGKDFAELNNQSSNLAISYMNIGEANYMMDELVKAKDDFEISRNFSMIAGVEFYTQNLFYARVLLALKDKTNAKVEAEKALELATKENDVKYLAEITQLLSKIAFIEKDFEVAYNFKEQSTSLMQQLNEAKQLNEIEKLRLNFELKKSKKELGLVKQREKYLSVIYLLVGLGLILLAELIFREIKESKMTAEMHQIQKRLIESELNKRENASSLFKATGFKASKSQDFEI